MFNPFLNTHKASIILSFSSNASEKAFNDKKLSTKTTEKENLFKLLEKEFNKQRELMIKETLELVA